MWTKSKALNKSYMSYFKLKPSGLSALNFRIAVLTIASVEAAKTVAIAKTAQIANPKLLAQLF